MSAVSTIFGLLLAAAILLPAPARALDCTVQLAMDGLPAALGRLDFRIGYPAGVTIVGESTDVACVSLVTDLDGVSVPGFFDDDDAAVVTSRVQSERGFSSFGALAICDFIAASKPPPSVFSAAADAAFDTNGSAVTSPTLLVAGTDCTGVSTTTTTTLIPTTSTSLPTSTTTLQVVTTTTTSTTSTLPPKPTCGDPDGSGGAPTATDSLAVLVASVGLAFCAPAVCDVDSSGSITASDALRVLRLAVGLSGILTCPA